MPGDDWKPESEVYLVGLYHVLDDDRRRVYLTPDLGSYAEFNVNDFLRYEQIAPESSPIPGVEMTRVFLRRGAPITWVYSHRETTADQMDLDVHSDLAHDVAKTPYHTISRLSTCCAGHMDHDYPSPPSTRLCTHTIYGYGPPAPLPHSTVPCWYTVTTHTI
jgi:hypothetical protein